MEKKQEEVMLFSWNWSGDKVSFYVLGGYNLDDIRDVTPENKAKEYVQRHPNIGDYCPGNPLEALANYRIEAFGHHPKVITNSEGERFLAGDEVYQAAEVITSGSTDNWWSAFEEALKVASERDTGLILKSWT